MNKEKIIKYAVSTAIILAVLHLIILPGLQNPNTITNSLSLAGFFFVIFWSLGWIKISIKTDSEKNPD